MTTALVVAAAVKQFDRNSTQYPIPTTYEGMSKVIYLFTSCVCFPLDELPGE